MSGLVLTAIPYNSQGWKEAGWTVKNWHKLAVPPVYSNYDVLVCLGKVPVPWHVHMSIWNGYHVSSITASVKMSKHYFEELMPPPPEQGDPYWHKQSGQGGAGKAFYEKYVGHTNIPGILQKHVEGKEYRVITVGNVVVQAFLKTPKETVGDFTWNWIGVEQAANINGLIPTAKKAAELLTAATDTEKIIIGWDIIRDHDGTAWLIEGNSAPGMNGNTVKRVLQQVMKVEGF